VSKVGEVQVDRGLEVLAELLGEAAATAARARVQSGETGSALTSLGLECAFARVWDREGLDRRSRSLLTIGVLIALRATHELKNHFRIGVRNGLTVRELEEAVMQAMPYAGLSATTPAIALLVETLRELGLDTESLTPAERGLM
jgi:4-carboxymuconolactone decarboxylase